MKQGAFNHLHKPLALQQLEDVGGEALDVAARMRSPVETLRARRGDCDARACVIER